MLFSSPEYQSKWRLRTPLLTIVFSLLAIWLWFNAYSTVIAIVQYYNPLPEWDYWRIPLNLQSYQAWDFRVLWKQHNEHRIVFPELFFAADTLFWHGHEYLPLLASVLTWAGTWIVFFWAVISDEKLSRPIRMGAFLLSGIMMFWPGSAAVLGAPFLLQWPLLQFAVVCAFAFLSRTNEARGNRYLAASIASGIVATYSSGNGMFIWPLLIACGVVLRLSKRRLAALVLSAVASVGLYFVGYQFSHDLNVRAILLHPIYTLGFLSAYLGMPFAEMHTRGYRIWIGGAALVLVLSFAFWAVRGNRIRTRPAVVLFGYYAFTVLTCLVTAGGRMNPDDRTFTSAKAARYATMPIAAWAAFIFLTVWVASRSRFPRRAVTVEVAIGVLMLIGFSKLGGWMKARGGEFADQQFAALSVEDGLRDRNLLRRLYIDPVAVSNLLPVLEKDQLTIYHKGRPGWLGKSIDEYAPVSDEKVNGAIALTLPVPTGFEVVGWVDDTQLRAPYRWVVLADDEKRIVGFGERFPSGTPGDLQAMKVPFSLTWAGFVETRRKDSHISAYVVDPRRRRLLPIPGSVEAPLMEAGEAADQGAPIADFHWSGDQYWTPHTARKGIDFGPAPNAPAYTSWSGADSFTSKAVSSDFPAPASGCLILPVLHGPIVEGLSVDLEDAKTGAIVASAPMQDYDMIWEFWRVKVPSVNRDLRIVVRDEGRGWGEWVGAATPSACR